MLIIAELMGYVEHDSAKDAAYDILHLHLLFGDVITIAEIKEELLSFELPKDMEKRMKVLDAFELLETMILMHGLTMDFWLADKSEDGLIS